MKRRMLPTVCAMVLAASMSACSSEPPQQVLFALDGSGSAQGMSRVYFAGISDWMTQHDHDVKVTVIGLTGTSGDTKACPSITYDVIGDGGTEDSKRADRESDRSSLMSLVAQLVTCLDRHRGTSDLAAFERIAGALPDGGTAVLFTDGMIHTNSMGVDRQTLTDPAADSGFLKQFESASRIDSVNVEIRGAGAGAELTDAELSGLHRRWDALVTAQGGTLTTFTTDIS